jgi:RND family efflux transporter MFP subunit
VNSESHDPIDPAGPTEPIAAPAAAPAPPACPAPPKLVNLRVLAWRVGAALLILGVPVLVWRVVSGSAKATTTASEPTAAIPVRVTPTTREDLYNRVTITAEFRPYLKVELHAKVSGYVEEMNVDIGDRVKAGELLARLEVPELRDELARAKAAQQRAEADHKDADLVYKRLSAVNHANPRLVAQQDLDAAEAKNLTTEAAIAAAKAEVNRNETLLGYTRITAPFDGVVTHRYADPGALIQAGTASDTQSMPLVCVSDNYRLRLDTAVSVGYVRYVHVGDPVTVLVESLNNKSFKGTISRVTQKVDDLTRTMITEVDVPNPDLEIVPGMYATVVFDLDRRPQALAIPVGAVDSDRKTTVYVVNQDQKVEQRMVKLGLETPDRWEVLAGLKEGDLVITEGRAKVQPGQKVHATPDDSSSQQ